MPSGLSSADWHARFLQQAAWTRSLRGYLFSRMGVPQSGRILDVGCGTGALFDELSRSGSLRLYGLDLDLDHLRFARIHSPAVGLTGGDALRLPFHDAAFDAVVCHFLLLWVTDPQQVILEMRRVTRPGGFVAALAEPDYGGRIDYPMELAELGQLQAQALQAQGTDPLGGRKLASIFHRAGLVGVETGVLGGQWSSPLSQETWESEWAMVEHDLEGMVPPAKLGKLRDLDRAAWQHGERILFVPTFYAVGQVPGN